MNRLISLFLILILSSFIPAFAAEDYICPMHPQIHGKKGDTCSICHMPLALVGAQHTHSETPESAQKENVTPAKPATKADAKISQ